MDLFKIVNDTMRMLRVDEDESLFPYKDSKGFWTIGVGRCIDKKPIPGRTLESLQEKGITREESDNFLKTDVGEALEGCIDNIPFFIDLDAVRQTILINMAFNMGIKGLLGFPKMLAGLGQRNIAEAVFQMVDSKWHLDVKNRAWRLEWMMATGKTAEEYK